MVIYFYKVCDPYGCFSNFSPHAIQMEGTHWPTVEHYYQAQKYVTSPSDEIVPLIHAADTPEQAAALGRCTSHQLRQDWETIKVEVMYKAVLKKFMTYPDIRNILLETGEEIIVEDSPTDYFWGCGAKKTGKNHLGKVLMSVRTEIRNKIQKLDIIA